MKNVLKIWICFAVLSGSVSLRADNLVVNGYGEEGTNAGFSGSAFDGTDFAIGNGSFVYGSAYYGASAGALIPLEQGQAYKFSFYLKSKNPVTQARAYTFLWQYDIDGKMINGWNVYQTDGTVTTLAADINDGDNEVLLTSAQGWIDHSAYYVRGIKFWDYSNSLGYTYPQGVYTRNYAAGTSPGANNGLWDQGSGLVVAENKIVLSAPWSHGFKEAGTVVSQNNAGGHFYLKSNFEVPSEWTYYEFIVQPSYFREAAAFIKPGWLMNYPSPGSQTALSGVRLEVVPQVPGIVSKDGFIGIGIDEPSNELEVAGTIRAEEIIVETGWADYVFDPDYKLRSLQDVESHIAEHGHLPGVPSATEIADKGVSVGDTQRLLIEKVEELTLYLLEKDKEMKKLVEQNSELRNRIERLEETNGYE